MPLRTLLLLLVLIVLESVTAVAQVPAPVLDAQAARVALVEQVGPTVVCIFGRDGGGGGSGVLISADGFALTNFHVTSGAGDVMRCGLNDGKLYDAVVVGIDPTGDVAMIQLLGRSDFPFAPLGNSDALSVGEWVYAMGNPFLLASDFTPTVTYGIVSGLHRYQYPAGTFLEYTDCVQFDTSLNPGNSGGPLFNAAGEVIGINGRGSFEKRGRVNVGAGYAISSNQVKHFLDHLRSGRVVDHGTAGLTVSTGSDGAVRVAALLDDSDAFRRGLRSGDEIVTFAGRPIRSANQFQNVLGIYPAGWTLPLVYRRGAETHELWISLADAHRESELRKFSETKPDEENPQPGKEKPEQPKLIPHEVPEPVPEELQKLVVKQPGFANYRYNEIEQQRVLKSLAAWGTLGDLTAGAVLKGKTADGRPFTLTLADAAAGLELGGRVYLQPLAAGGELVDEPPGSGGFLAGCALLRRALAGQTAELAQFYYIGSEPLDGNGPQVDVLAAADRGGLLRLYVSRENPQPVGFDFRLSPATAACRVRFTDELRDGPGYRLPTVWRVAGGAVELFVLNVEEIAALRGQK